MSTLSRTIGFAFVGLTIFSVGCTKTLKKESVEGSIKSAFEKSGFKFKSVTCPAGKQAKAGDAFDCTAELDDGGKATINVKQKDDKGSLEYNAAGLAITEAQVVAKWKSDGDVKCAKKAAFIKKGDVFACDITSGANTGKIEITTDDDKKFSEKLTMAGQEPKVQSDDEAAAAAAPEGTTEEE